MLYRRRNEIERLFRRLKGFRRIFSRLTSSMLCSGPSSTSRSSSKLYELCEQALVRPKGTSFVNGCGPE